MKSTKINTDAIGRRTAPYQIPRHCERSEVISNPTSSLRAKQYQNHSVIKNEAK
jgi:hypothetical protein